ncbi:MAG TPA: oligopeptide:H+ symporter [Rhizomicrobium sp.]|nr:oligopeptide:H+ symporter [Rhizomicrobium sp.]
MSKSSSDTVFLGHPAGLGWLSGSEFWERFSYYGMQALLVLYMTHQFLNPGHFDHALGFAPFQRLLEFLYRRPLSGVALASATYGFYAGFVYLTPIAGGLIADRWLGKTATVTVGAILMATGHFLMAFDVSFVIALFCLLAGVGCFKGNIAAQVGDLYAEGDLRRADAFQIYYIGIQMAVIISPLICGTLGESVGWHWGFGAAGVGMLIGLITYLKGRYSFPKETTGRNGARIARPPMTGRDRKAVILLILLVPVLGLSLVGNQEIYNAYLVWAEKNFQLVFFGRAMPITWMLSVDSFVSTVLIALSVMFWRWYGKHRQEPDEVTKIAIGVFVAALAPTVLALPSLTVARTGHPVSLAWAVAFHIVNDLGFANMLPVGLALYSRAAPKGWEGVMVAVYLLQLFLGNLLTGYLGGLLGTMSDASFWFLHVGLMLISVLLIVLARLFFGKVLAPA